MMVWNILTSHLQFREFSRQIFAILTADLIVWNLYCGLRSSPDGCAFLRDMLSPLHLIPPHDVFQLIVCLRLKPDFPAMQPIILQEMRSLQHGSQSATSRTGSVSSFDNSSIYPLSSPNAPVPADRSPRVADAPNGVPLPQRFNTVIHAPELKQDGKPRRTAPEGMEFGCPFPQCVGKPGNKRAGDFNRHIFHIHPGSFVNAFHHLRDVSSHAEPQTPARRSDSSFNGRSPGSSQNDGSKNGYMDPAQFDFFGATGVYTMPPDAPYHHDEMDQ